ncbi:MAG: RagB/SusD family nutrient uptake outer membrane protein [Saprospiraceae bacterium]
MKKTIKLRLMAASMLFSLLFIWACSEDFLEVPPTGQLANEQLKSKAGIEGLLIGAYAPLRGFGSFYDGPSNWVTGSILGGDANKGTNAGDQNVINPIQRFETQPTDGGPVIDKWRALFEGVSRANAVLRILAEAGPDVTEADKKRISAEARFLRGHYYFDLKRIYNNVPFLDETLDYGSGIEKVPNTTDIWPKIEEDFRFAAANLPETQAAAGRANKWAATAYLGKTLLYQKKYADAKAQFDQVIANGVTTNGKKYGLLANYANIFNPAFDNSEESVFAVQMSVNTGTTNNAFPENVLNFPYNGGPAGCCGFNQPSIELVNSFRTNANGLPLLDGSYNGAANAVKTDFGILSKDPFTPDAGNLDPRLDHSVGRRGIPYLDWGNHPGFDWIRDQTYAGPYAPKKYVFSQAQQNAFTDGSSWTRGYIATNYHIIRFADVLLMAAEAEIEAGSLEKAREYVNRVRSRAADPSSWVKTSGGANAANYVIGLYNTPWTDKATATAAVRFERKLELSGEGHRFFDLVRWGVADQVINAYLAYEGNILKVALGGARFTANKNEYYPIPQDQIDRQAGVLKQNPGY